MAPRKRQLPGTRPTANHRRNAVDKKSLTHPRTLAEKPRTADCVGCRAERPRRLLVTVPEGPFDGLPFLDGDRGCHPCTKHAARFFVSVRVGANI